jgi:hypothetical protein
MSLAALVAADGPAEPDPVLAARRERMRWMALLSAIGGVVIASRWLLRALGPDDYDSFSFLLAIRDRFDLAHFQPQFPGYPVYVEAGRLLVRLGVPALDAGTGIAALASGATAVGLAIIAGRLGGRAAALATAGLYAVAWLPWLSGAGMLSEPLAMALATLAVACLVVESPRLFAAGVLAGLLLGTRASYWPLLVSCAVWAFLGGSKPDLRSLGRHLAGVAVGLFVWAPAFVAHFGAANLWQLGLTHLRGHFQDWGNTVVTRPAPGLRLTSFARDVFYDGLAPNAIALAAVAALTAAAWLWGPGPRPSRRALAAWALVLIPYAAWAFFAQNVLTQPRHVLPLCTGLCLALGLLLARRPPLAAAAIAAMAAVSLPLARQRHDTPPGPAQAAAWAAAQYGAEADETAIFANRSVRFFDEAARGWSPPWLVDNCGVLGDVWVDLAHLDRLPRNVLVTDELQRLDDPPPARLSAQLVPGPRFCRDPRIDRAVPCVQLYQLQWRLP